MQDNAASTGPSYPSHEARLLNEAIAALGYLNTEAFEHLLPLMPRCLYEHPRQVATWLRKQGEQISPAEKKALGIRRNAFMSRQALADLTAKGLASPLKAHEVTLLRATFSMFRLRTITNGLNSGAAEFRFSATHSECRGCERLQGSFALRHEVSPDSPPDCSREACSLHIDAKFDWLGPALNPEGENSFNIYRRVNNLQFLLKSITPNDEAGTSHYLQFTLRCLRCWSEEAGIPTQTQPNEIVRCFNCGEEFGALEHVRAAGMLTGKAYLRRQRL